MRDLFRETVFGRFVHFASGGSLFAHAEQRDPSLLQKYRVNKSSASSDTSVNAALGDREGVKTDPEKGSDVLLVDWVENDPEV